MIGYKILLTRSVISSNEREHVNFFICFFASSCCMVSKLYRPKRQMYLYNFWLNNQNNYFTEVNSVWWGSWPVRNWRFLLDGSVTFFTKSGSGCNLCACWEKSFKSSPLEEKLHTWILLCQMGQHFLGSWIYSTITSYFIFIFI